MDTQQAKNRRVQRLRDMRRRKAVCIECGKEKLPTSTYCQVCLDKHKIWEAQREANKNSKTVGSKEENPINDKDVQPLERNQAPQKHKPFTPYEDF